MLKIYMLGAIAFNGVAGVMNQQPLVGYHSGQLPLVSSEALQASINADNLSSRAKTLYDIAKLGEEEYNHPTRVIGSEGHLGTLAYVYSNLALLDGYYHVSNQTFPAVTGTVFSSRLVLQGRVPDSAVPMGLTPPTKDKEPVFANLVLVLNDGCDYGDYPAALEGNIAMIRRGTCSFGQKSDLAGVAGAVAAIVYNTEDDSLQGTLGTPSENHVATFGLSGVDAVPVIDLLKNGATVEASAFIDSEVKTISTTNIFAQTIEGDPDNCVMLGGHSDSVTEGPGINDNGSGSLTVLEVAVQLTKFRVNNCVRFAWWAAEEEGLLGSDFYTANLSEEENLKIRLFMDYDMLASPNFAYQVYDARNDENPAGSEELRNLYLDWYGEQGVNHTFIPFDGRSDYAGFILHGIPSGGIATGAEGVKTSQEMEMFGGVAGEWYNQCYHQLCDDLGNLNMTAWEINSKLVAHSVATYALSFDGFPKRTLQNASTSALARRTLPRYHGHKLNM